MKGNSVIIEGIEFAIAEALNFDYYSPFIDNEEVTVQGESINPRGNYTMPFKIKGNGQLAQITKNAQVLQANDAKVTFTNCALISGGIVIEGGNVDVIRLPSNLNNRDWEAECVFYSVSAGFAEALQDLNVKDVFIHEDILIQGNDIRALILVLQTQFPGQVVVTLGPNLEIQGIDIDRNLDIWAWLYDNRTFDYFQETAFYANNVNEEETTYSPEVELGCEFFRFPCYRAEFEDAGTETHHQILNHTDDNGKIVGYIADVIRAGSNDYVVYTPLRNQIVPMYFYHKILRACFTQAGYTLTGDLIESAQFQKLILPNTYSILKEQVLEVTNMWGTNPGDARNFLYSQDLTYIKSRNHMPDMPVIDFIRDFMLRFNVSLIFEGTQVRIAPNVLEKVQASFDNLHPEVIIEHAKKKGVTIQNNFPTDDTSYATQTTYKEDIAIDIQESVDDTIQPSLDDGEIYLQNDKNSIILKDSTLLGGFELEVNNLVKYTTGKDKVYSAELVPVEMKEDATIFENDPGSYAAVMTFMPYFGHTPSYESLGIFSMEWYSNFGGASDLHDNIVLPSYTFTEGPSEKKLALYHGFQQTLDSDALDISYPYMSYHNYAPGDGTEVKLGDWHLGWIGEEGIVVTFWRGFTNKFNKNRKVIFRIYATWEQIKNHNWQRSQIIRGKKYYVSAIKFSMPGIMHGQPAIVDCWEI